MSDLDEELEIIIDRGNIPSGIIEALARICANRATTDDDTMAKHWGAAAVRLEKVGIAIERLGL